MFGGRLAVGVELALLPNSRMLSLTEATHSLNEHLGLGVPLQSVSFVVEMQPFVFHLHQW